MLARRASSLRALHGLVLNAVYQNTEGEPVFRKRVHPAAMN